MVPMNGDGLIERMFAREDYLLRRGLDPHLDEWETLGFEPLYEETVEHWKKQCLDMTEDRPEESCQSKAFFRPGFIKA